MWYRRCVNNNSLGFLAGKEGKCEYTDAKDLPKFYNGYVKFKPR